MKISKGTGILNRAKKYINLSTLVTMYQSFIYPYLTYCLEVWRGAGDVYLLSLFKLQKRVVRIMKSLPNRAHTKPICSDLKLLNINQLYKQKILFLMFKYIRGCLPKLFYNYYIRNVDIYSHVTRQQNKLHAHKCTRSVAQKAIRCYGVTSRNWFSSKVCVDVSFTCYKRALKTFLLNQVYFLLQIISSNVLYIIWLYHALLHFFYFLQFRKRNFLRAHTPVGVLTSLSLDAIYFIYYFIYIILFCFHIVFLMTINTFWIELKIYCIFIFCCWLK